jgi:hypothetical protein
MHAPSGDIQELTSLPAFTAAVTAASGCMVVTDRSVPTRFHRAQCQSLKPEYFEMKVMKNARRRGQYFLAPSYESAAAKFSGKPCAVCRPDGVSAIRTPSAGTPPSLIT